MNDISNRLLRFFRGKAPNAITQLPSTSATGDETIDFIWSLGWEGNTILKGGDPLVTPLKFTRDDIAGLKAAHYIVRTALKKKVFDDAALAAVRTMPSLMLKIASYHEESVRALEQALETKKTEYILWYQRYKKYWEEGNNEGLLSLYPYEARRLYAHGDDEVPVRQGNVVPIERSLIASCLRAMLESKDDLLLERPDVFKVIDEEEDSLNIKINRHSSVFQAVKTVSAGLDEALYPKPKRMPRIIHFPLPPQ